jgi:general secretion pathway protein A
MDYYKLLQLEREPFSNSPDPEFFFQSRQHRGCLQKLELALRLKRGLNVVLGDIGSGKTTLCREIIRKFAVEPAFETHLILDPAFGITEEFLKVLHTMLCDHPAQADGTTSALKEAIKQTLYQKGVDQGRTVILIIDEGQKITAPCIEILRELLNYETNTYKLLQIVIFAQEEFQSILAEHPNFADRVNLLHHLGPMNFSDTRQLIRHRLKLASGRPKPVEPFTLPALWAIYRYSQGYPRRIIHLCHQSMLAMIIQNRTRAGWRLIRSCQQRSLPVRGRRSRLPAIGVTAVIAAAAVILFGPDFKTTSVYQAILEKISRPTAVGVPLQPAAPAVGIVPDIANPHPATEIAPRPIAIPAPIAELEPVQQKAIVLPTPSIQPTERSLSETALAEDAKPEPIQAVPSSLGTLRVNSGDTLYQMISTVYGNYRTEYMEAVLRANPQIDNPDAIQHGSTVTFPALRFASRPAFSTARWIVLSEHRSLTSARQATAELKRQWGAPLKWVTTWTPTQMLTFHLVYGGVVANEINVHAILESMPQPLAAQARIVSAWPADAHFFSDPNTPAALAGGERMKR